jgi:PAS domain S-box-containing protein
MKIPATQPGETGLSAADLKVIVDAIPAALFVKDAQSRILLMNRECEEQWGVSFAHLAGTDGSAFFPPDQMKTFLAADQRVFAGRRQLEYEEKHWNVSLRSSQDVHTTKKPSYDNDGNPRFLIGFSLDIQKRKLAEAQLAATEVKLRNLFEMSPLGIGLNDLSGRFLEFNPALERICGYPRDELMALDYWDLTPKEYMPLETKHLHDLQTRGHYGPYEKEYVRKDGSRVPIRLNGVLITASDGTQYIWSIVEDISAAKSSADQLEESSERFLHLVNSIPQMVWTASIDGKMTFVNRQLTQFLGVATDHPHTALRSLFRSLSPAGRRDLNEIWNQHGLQSQTEFSLEVQALRHDGEYRWLMLHAIPIKNREGQIARWIGTMTDVSERRLADQNLRETQKLEAIGNLTGGLAHDFNNLLGIILGNLDMLHASALGPTAAAQVQVALSAAERGAELTKSLLAVARRQTAKPTRLHLKDILQGLEPLLVHTVGVRNQLVVRSELDQATALVDAVALESSILNLVINARDAMPAGGTLRVILRAPSKLESAELAHGPYATIEIEDTGCSMPPDVVSKATNPFFTTKDRGHGTGLGLAMVNAFAHDSGGRLHIQSAVGVGTSVQLTLPLTSEPSQAPTQVLAQASAAHRTASVLIVNDELELLALLEGWLTDAGYRVRRCISGEQAWAAIQTQTPEILITDVIMPGKMDGLELARKAQALSPSLRIILVSGYPIDSEKAVHDMAWPLVMKPYRREEILHRLHNPVSIQDRAGAAETKRAGAHN